MSPPAKPMTARRSLQTRVPGFPPATQAEELSIVETGLDVTSPNEEQATSIAGTPQSPQEPPPVATDNEPQREVARENLDPASRAPRSSRRTARTDGGSKAVVKPGGPRVQTNFRLYETEMQYLKRLKREFEDDGIKTDITELVHAIVYATRRGELDPLEILRRWRTDLNEF